MYVCLNNDGEACESGDGVMLAVDVRTQEGRAFLHVYQAARRGGFSHSVAMKNAEDRAIDPR